MIDRLGQSLATWLLPVNVWTAALLVCALVLDRALARHARASLRIALYAPVALRAIVPLSWSFPIAHLPRVAIHLPVDVVAGTAASASASVPTAPWFTLVAIAYAGVAVALGLRAMLRRLALSRALASARVLPVEGVPCPVLLHSELGPMVVGLLAPRIVLPEAMVDATITPALACVMKHEVAHLRRGDAWLSAVLETALVALWPVVPLWIAALRVRHLMELACDEAALAGADAAERRQYGHILLDVAEQGSLAFAGAGTLHFGSTLRARVEAIALQRHWPRAVQASLVALAVAGFVACSSAGTGPIPDATGGTRTAAAGQPLDEYGYQYASDPLSAAAQAQATAQGTPPGGNGGRLPPESIQAVVRQNFGAFRSCYESGLQQNAKLAGTVAVQFVINQDGSVQGASVATNQEAGNDTTPLADPNVVQCVVGGFGKLKFPAPQGGYVTVVYPIVFAPGD
jgi:beta-lactamase regulating signal transducer with metallopeptidase domain